MTKLPGSRKSFLEQEHRVGALRGMLWAADGVVKEDCVQFWAIHGGLRTVAVKDIVDIR